MTHDLRPIFTTKIKLILLSLLTILSPLCISKDAKPSDTEILNTKEALRAQSLAEIKANISGLKKHAQTFILNVYFDNIFHGFRFDFISDT